MERLVEILTAWVTAVLDALGSAIGATIRLFDTPAQMLGVPVEIFAAALLCLLLIALWRGMSRFIM
jgi:hypothetical protein